MASYYVRDKCLSRFFFAPVAQPDVLLNFPPLVAVFMGFDWPVVGFAEGMLWVANDFCYHNVEGGVGEASIERESCFKTRWRKGDGKM